MVQEGSRACVGPTNSLSEHGVRVWSTSDVDLRENYILLHARLSTISPEAFPCDYSTGRPFSSVPLLTRVRFFFFSFSFGFLCFFIVSFCFFAGFFVYLFPFVFSPFSLFIPFLLGFFFVFPFVPFSAFIDIFFYCADRPTALPRLTDF